MEDLNHLLKREQEEIMRAKASACGVTRQVHEGLAHSYAQRIQNHRLPYRSVAISGHRSFDPNPFGGGGSQL